MKFADIISLNSAANWWIIRSCSLLTQRKATPSLLPKSKINDLVGSLVKTPCLKLQPFIKLSFSTDFNVTIFKIINMNKG